MIEKSELQKTQKRIKKHIHKTPVFQSSQINKIVGAEIFFKCENFQKMGAFKMRGAINTLLQLNETDRKKGVATHSSGNFAQALALSAQLINIPAYIVMPSDAPQVKKDAVKGYGGIISECIPTLEARETGVQKIIDETGATFVHPYNQEEVIAGQGTAAMELINDYPNLDSIITPVGGGGLLSGTALAAKYFSPSTKVYGAEPEDADDAFRSIKAGYIIPQEGTKTIADGLRTSLGDKCFEILKDELEDILCVSEKEIIAAMKLVWERMKIIIEPSSAVALAAIIKNKEIFKNQKIGLIISGGNVDLSKLPF